MLKGMQNPNGRKSQGVACSHRRWLSSSQSALSALLQLANTGCTDLAEREEKANRSCTKSFLGALLCLRTSVALTPEEAEWRRQTERGCHAPASSSIKLAFSQSGTLFLASKHPP